MERNNYWNESSAAEQAEYKWILPDLEGLDAQEVLKQQVQIKLIYTYIKTDTCSFAFVFLFL